MPSDNLLSTIPNKPTLKIGKKKEIPNNKKVSYVKKNPEKSKQKRTSTKTMSSLERGDIILHTF